METLAKQMKNMANEALEYNTANFIEKLEETIYNAAETGCKHVCTSRVKHDHKKEPVRSSIVFQWLEENGFTITGAWRFPDTTVYW